MKDSHLTLRLPAALARALARKARTAGVPKSQLVREAVARYLAPADALGSSRPPVTARDLAARWPTLPRMAPEDVDDFAADIAAARAALPVPRPPWE